MVTVEVRPGCYVEARRVTVEVQPYLRATVEADGVEPIVLTGLDAALLQLRLQGEAIAARPVIPETCLG